MKHIHTEALSYFNQLRDRAIEEKIRASDAIRMVMNVYHLSRKELKHTASAVGINPLTARNVYDRLSGV